jgi:hypothetical protein
VSQRQDRVGGQVRIRGMPAAAPHRHLELIRRRIDHAAVARHQPVRQHRLHVRADHRLHALLSQDPGGGHVQRAGRIRLLPRLQHDEQRHRGGGSLQAPGHRGHRGQMHVVPARVHGTVASRP